MVNVRANGHNLVHFDHHMDKGWRRNGKMQEFVPETTEMFSVAVRLRWKVGVNPTADSHDGYGIKRCPYTWCTIMIQCLIKEDGTLHIHDRRMQMPLPISPRLWALHNQTRRTTTPLYPPYIVSAPIFSERHAVDTEPWEIDRPAFALEGYRMLNPSVAFCFLCLLRGHLAWILVRRWWSGRWYRVEPSQNLTRDLCPPSGYSDIQHQGVLKYVRGVIRLFDGGCRARLEWAVSIGNDELRAGIP